MSIVMPAYNSEKLLGESVASVMAQTYREWELLIVDDASEDGTASIAERLAREDSRVRLIRLEQNGGVANARNVGMQAALGRYLAFLDSDDLWLPEKLEMQLGFMKEKEAGFSFTSYRFLAPMGTLGKPVSVPDKVGYAELLKGNAIGCLTVMIDREKIPPFAMPAIGHEDYVAWLSVLKKGHTAWGLQKDLARYRVSAKSVSGDKKRSAAWTWSIYREVEGLTFTKAAWCFAHYSMKAVRKHFIGG